MPVPSNVGDLSPNPAANSPTGNETVGPNLDDYLRSGFAFTRQIAVDFAGDAAPVNPFAYMLWADTANGVTKRRSADNTKWQIEGRLFRSALPIVPSDDIPTSDIGPIAVAGQGLMEWDGAKYAVSEPAHGQCRFVFVSSTECRLMPYDGNGLVINGRQYRIGAAGVPITTAATAVNGRYFVFAKDDGSGGIALELASTAGASYSVHTDGVTIKTGDPTRTLVGWLGTTSANGFQDDQNSRRLVASWFNRRRRSVQETVIGSLASTVFTPIGGGRGLFNWAGEEVEATISGYGNITGANYYSIRGVRDGVMNVPESTAGRSSGGPAAVSSKSVDTPTEGFAAYQASGLISGSFTALVVTISVSTNI